MPAFCRASDRERMTDREMQRLERAQDDEQPALSPPTDDVDGGDAVEMVDVELVIDEPRQVPRGTWFMHNTLSSKPRSKPFPTPDPERILEHCRLVSALKYSPSYLQGSSLPPPTLMMCKLANAINFLSRQHQCQA